MSGPDLSTRPHERVCQGTRVEAPPDRTRVLRLGVDDRGAERLEPIERVVELFDDQPLEPRIAGRALVAEIVQRAVAPDDAARQQHRAARAVALLGPGP